MSNINNKIKSGSFLRTVCLLGLLVGLFAAGVRAQTSELPAMKDYKGVTIGMNAGEVRDKLGSAKVEDKDGLFYVFSDDETAQIVLDEDKKVKVISIDYSGEYKNPPTAADVFGKNIEIKAKADGSIYKMMRYTDAGFWLAYSRLADENPAVSITIKKL